jgi:Putative adhesin
MSNRIGIFALLAGASCAISGVAGAQDDERLVVPLSDPSRPARLEIALFSGDISVEAYDGNEVVIVADTPIRDADNAAPPRADGLRQIQSSSVGLTVEENDNTVSVRMDFSPKNADLEIRVPRRTSVKASLVNGGDVEITGLTGEHELSNVNGDVIATDLAGSAVINATNGDVRATFTTVDVTKSMSFTSFNGDVDVTLPANLAADLIVASQQGDVYTDFDVVAQDDPPNVQQRGGPSGGRQVRWSQQTRYAIGGGGPDIQLRTFNGDVMIRRR